MRVWRGRHSRRQILEQNRQIRAKGSYYDNSVSIVAFARTLGYEDYDGLGWTAAWCSRPQATRTIKAALNQK
ncbi:UNVERIFIED_ORG: hypothetical protein GGE64_001028 [Rhizobium etli]|nr:hypothetical protein [Rhizobium sp. Kim5]ARQ57561.1 hypothetical protein Kim5_CH01464 [Rhizobium sp. Kim5]RSB92071.1 hypothetical protein EFR00_22715 [Rhizobium sophoriradicis]